MGEMSQADELRKALEARLRVWLGYGKGSQYVANAAIEDVQAILAAHPPEPAGDKNLADLRRDIAWIIASHAPATQYDYIKADRIIEVFKSVLFGDSLRAHPPKETKG